LGATAAKVVPIGQLASARNAGFGSTAEGNVISVEEQLEN
jgi:hypothetical protein